MNMAGNMPDKRNWAMQDLGSRGLQGSQRQECRVLRGRDVGFSEAGIEGLQRQELRVLRGRDLGFSEAGIEGFQRQELRVFRGRNCL